MSGSALELVRNVSKTDPRPPLFLGQVEKCLLSDDPEAYQRAVHGPTLTIEHLIPGIAARQHKRLLNDIHNRHENQVCLCPGCHQALDNGEDLHVHHVRPKHHGGTEDLTNLRLVHQTCHRQIHSSSAPLGVRRLLEPCTR